VSENEDLGQRGECQDARACGCVEEYFDLAAVSRHFNKTISRTRLDRLISQETERVPFSRPLTDVDLQAAIIHATHINFLIDRMQQSIMSVSTVRRRETDEFCENEILIVDPLVGEFRAIFLTPKTPGPHPAVIVLHGHTLSPEEWRAAFSADSFVKRGYAVFIPQLRAMCAGQSEDAVTRELAMSGLSFIGVQIYEVLLDLNFLNSLSYINKKKIALVAHSGGCCIGTAAIRIIPSIQAYVLDSECDYLGPVKSVRDEFLHQFLPGLHSLRLLVNDFCSTPTPTLLVPYNPQGYTSGVLSEILDFLDKHLK
jgi:hypothetical protein